jgi:hypothetical protein
MSLGSEHPWRLRLQQEREIAFDHVMVSTEYALAREAAMIGSELGRAGVPFDPATLIALRILESSSAACVDPAGCLEAMIEQGVLVRSVALTLELLEEAA